MQNSLEILLQQLQDAELGGFDAQKDYAPPYRSLLTKKKFWQKILNTLPSIFYSIPKTENGTFRSSTERTMRTTDILGKFRFLVKKMIQTKIFRNRHPRNLGRNRR
jgi:IS1 family transposase